MGGRRTTANRAQKAAAGYTNWNWVTEQVAQGGFPGDPNRLVFTPEVFRVFDVVVFTAQEAIPKPLRAPRGKTAYALPLDDEFYRPVPSEVATYAHQLAQRLADHVRAREKVLVTCYQGVNRSGLLTALTLMHAYGFSGAQAVQLIRARRKPETGHMVLGNPMFENYIKSVRIS